MIIYSFIPTHTHIPALTQCYTHFVNQTLWLIFLTYTFTQAHTHIPILLPLGLISKVIHTQQSYTWSVLPDEIFKNPYFNKNPYANSMGIKLKYGSCSKYKQHIFS